MKKKKKSSPNNTLSPLKIPGNCYRYPLVLLETGIKRVKLELLEHHPEHACLINKTYLILLEKLKLMKLSNEKFVTLELAPELKWMTLKDKSFFLNKPTLPTRWLQISALGLIHTIWIQRLVMTLEIMPCMFYTCLKLNANLLSLKIQ